MGKNGDLNTENRGGNRGAEQWLVALVVGVSDQGHARGKEFGTSRFNADINTVLNWRTGCSSLSSARGVGDVEGEAVVEARVFAALKLGLSNCGLEGHVPQTRSLSLVGLAALEIAQECSLGNLAGTSTDGLVVLSPVNRQAQVAPQIFEVLLIFNGQALAQLHEITTRDRHLIASLDGLAFASNMRGLKVWIIGEGRIDANPKVVLHAALCGQAIVVPAHGVKDRLTLHSLETCDDIGVRVREHVADVKRTRNRGRGSVDRVDLLAGAASIKTVSSLIFPTLVPLGFEAFSGDLVRHLGCGQRGWFGLALSAHTYSPSESWTYYRPSLRFIGPPV